MSHNYPYRQPTSESNFRPDPGPYGSSDLRRSSSDHDFYRPPQESFPLSQLSPSSSSSSRGAQWSQDGALSILNSCGLEPGDLALLAELPEDVLTVESLPQVLAQMKGKRGTVKEFPPHVPSPTSSSSSYIPSSSHQSTASPSTNKWDHSHNQPLQYPLDHLSLSSLPPELDCWGNPKTSTSSSSGYVVDFHHRPGPSEYGAMGSDASPVSSHDYNHRPGPSEYGKMGSDPSPVSSQDYNYRPGPSEYGKTSRDAGAVSYQDYNHRQGQSKYGKEGRDSGPVSSQDYNHRPGPSQYGKTGRDAVPLSSQDRLSFSSAGTNKRTRPSRFAPAEPADNKSAPERPSRSRWGHNESETSSTRSSSNQTATSIPCKKEALDFHGTTPSAFPYSCSLCDITVMSDKAWFKHINGHHHADGQLNLLQQFPNWDCRLETVCSTENQPEIRKDKGKPAQQPQTANQNSSNSKANKTIQKKTTEKSKVVCVKFPAQSVDEAYLKKLTEPFGKIVKILMFPSLAFVELGSVDQAKDLVKFHANYPPTVNGEQMEFSISNTFVFLQSSRVVSFSPAPSGEDSRSDLISIIKRFGPPLYTLFLPSKAFVEMKNTPDAQKLVDYYSSKSLRINNDVIQVSFSGEYKSLMRVASAKRYEEETCSTKSTRSTSREKEDKTAETKRRRSSKDREEEGEKSSRDKRTRTRSRSREKSNKEKSTRSRSREKSKEKSCRERKPRTRSRSREKATKEKSSRTRSRSREKSKEKSSRERKSRTRTRSRSREKSTKEKSSRTRSGSREESKEKSSRERRSRSKSKSREKSNSQSSGESRSEEKSVVPEKTETTDSESRTVPVPDPDPDPDPDPVPDSRPAAEVKEEPEEEAESSEEESDIEGMEVIGEDGQSLEDEEALDDDAVEEEEEKMEEDDCPAETTDSPKKDTEEEVKDGEAGEEQTVMDEEEKVTEEDEKPSAEKEEQEDGEAGDQENVMEKEKEKSSIEKEEVEEAEEAQLEEEEEEEPDFPIDLENCITLDELGEDQSDHEDEDIRDEHKSTRVVLFNNVPVTLFTDTDLINVVKDYGTPVKFLRCPGQCKAFVEMTSSSEALRATNELRKFCLNGSRVATLLSNKYKRLSNGYPVPMVQDEKEPRRSERRNKEEPDKRKSERRKESSKKTPEKELTSKKTPEKESTSKKTPEKESASKETPEKESASKKTPERQTRSKTTKNKPSEKDSSRDPSEKKPSGKKTPEKKSVAVNGSAMTSRPTPEKDSANKKTSENESSSAENKTLKRKGTHENDSVPEKKDKKPKCDETEKENLETLGKEGSAEKMSETDECKDKKTSETDECKDKKTSETDECKDKKTSETDECKDKKTSETDEYKDKKTSKKDDCKDKKMSEKDKHKDETIPETKKSSDKKTSETNEHKAEKSCDVLEETSEPGLEDSPSPDQPDSTGDLPKPQTEQEAAADRLQDSHAADQVQQGPGAAGGAAELQEPTRPVGTEFVRPVVGYFCNLCELIYADEDEAKLQHCSSLTHYMKYQEKTGKDPWTS